MIKKILCLAAAAAFVMYMTSPVYAEEFYGSSGWNVKFDGKKMSSNFKASDMKEEVYQLLPGDTIRLQVNIQNSAQKTSDWYMSNEVLESLEESQNAANGGSYTYILTYVDDKNKETVLYSSESVGGEGKSKAGVGLNQATDSLSEYFFLDRLESTGKGTVYLTVGLDGETQGNGYQDTLASLQMNFAAAETASISGGGRTPHTATPGSPPDRDTGRNLPKTGDETNILPYCAAALISGMILLLLGVSALKKTGEETEVQA